VRRGQGGARHPPRSTPVDEGAIVGGGAAFPSGGQGCWRSQRWTDARGSPSPARSGRPAVRAGRPERAARDGALPCTRPAAREAPALPPHWPTPAPCPARGTDRTYEAFERRYAGDHSWEGLQEDEQGRLRPVVRRDGAASERRHRGAGPG
jgi:hypothetical protein